MLGNFPQAFSDVGLINSALNLSRQTGPAEERAEPQTARLHSRLWPNPLRVTNRHDLHHAGMGAGLERRSTIAFAPAARAEIGSATGAGAGQAGRTTIATDSSIIARVCSNAYEQCT